MASSPVGSRLATSRATASIAGATTSVNSFQYAATDAAHGFARRPTSDGTSVSVYTPPAVWERRVAESRGGCRWARTQHRMMNSSTRLQNLLENGSSQADIRGERRTSPRASTRIEGGHGDEQARSYTPGERVCRGLAAIAAYAGDQTVLGKSFSVKARPGNPTKVEASAFEKNSDDTLVGDPTAADSTEGAILQIFVNGGTPPSQPLRPQPGNQQQGQAVLVG